MIKGPQLYAKGATEFEVHLSHRHKKVATVEARVDDPSEGCVPAWGPGPGCPGRSVEECPDWTVVATPTLGVETVGVQSQ